VKQKLNTANAWDGHCGKRWSPLSDEFRAKVGQLRIRPKSGKQRRLNQSEILFIIWVEHLQYLGQPMGDTILMLNNNDLEIGSRQ